MTSIQSNTEYDYKCIQMGFRRKSNDLFESVSQEFTLLILGSSICNENPFITPSTNAIGFYVICQTKDQSVTVKMVHETLFYLTNFNKLQTF